jgi:hypothetical protein
MKFIDQILSNSQIKEAKLYGPSKKAAERPETGITIQTPAAFHVIKDCATLANKYLPHFVFGHYANPFQVLKGKFTKADIIEFVTEASSDIVMYQLLVLVVGKVESTMPQLKASITSVDTSSFIGTSADPYGDYESYTSAPVVQQQDTVSILCAAFDVTQ